MAGFTGWEKTVLRGVGAPVTRSNLRLLRAWQQAEGGSASFNPLNTTQPASGAGSYNSVGVRNYRSAAQGAQATVQTLLNGHYGPIVQGLRQSAHPDRIAQSIADSPWGTGSGVLRVLGSGGGQPVAYPATAAPPAAPQTMRIPGSRIQQPPRLTIRAPKPVDLTPFFTQSLGRMALGADPVEQLQQLSRSLTPQLLAPVQLASIPRPDIVTPARNIDLRGHTLTPQHAIDPGGGWGGSYHPATVLADMAERYGLVPTSQKRDTKLSASGLPSDHWVGSKNAYAYDMGGSVAKMDEAARALTQRLGIPYKGGALVATKILNGLRYQILYRTNVGGNHFNHIHIGVKHL